MILSPSQVESFDSCTPFGCNRKWWFKSVQKIPEKSNPNQLLGTEIHAEFEKFLLTGKAGSKYFDAAQRILEDLRLSFYGVETWVFTEVGGVKFRGKVDVLLGSKERVSGILDWKTTSDFRYAKSGEELARNTQLMVYAHAIQANFPTTPTLDLVHVYVRTKGKPQVRQVQISVDKAHVDNYVLETLTPLVKSMAEVAKEVDVKRIKPDLSKCKWCAYANICPKGENMPTIKDLMKAREQVQTPPKPEPILPHDAPASKPEIAAKPVEGAPTPRGKKAKTGGDVADSEQQAMLAQIRALREQGISAYAPPMEPYQPNETTLKVSKVKVTHGITLNLGNFESARIDVGLEAESIEGNFQDTLKFLEQQCKEEVNRQSKVYEDLIEARKAAK